MFAGPARARYRGMGRRLTRARFENFGFDTGRQPWSVGALTLLLSAPRVYQPLAEAWETRHPGTLRALQRLVDSECVSYQGPVIRNTRTEQTAARPSRTSRRYLITAEGRRNLGATDADPMVFAEVLARPDLAHVSAIAAFLQQFDLKGPDTRYGLSCTHASLRSATSDRLGRYWINVLTGAGLLRMLDEQIADVRQIIPAHWRETRELRANLSAVLDLYGSGRDIPASLAARRPIRNRTLADIDPRVGVAGACDYDHDVVAQQILAAILRSPRCITDDMFTVEGRHPVSVDRSPELVRFTAAGPSTLYCQPDATFEEACPRSGARRVSFLEYERLSGRTQAWSHIERALGYLATRTTADQSAILRFAVDSDRRAAAYTDLIEAFAAYGRANPHRLPGNQVTLAVATVPDINSAPDPLTPAVWRQVDLPAGTGTDVVLHPTGATPYGDYCGR
jgi:hypothetical protein